MAMIIKDGIRKEVADGNKITAACEELDVIFGCKEGLCETCRVTVVSGLDNLNSLTQNEQEMNVELPDRLACQCIIKEGVVEISQSVKKSSFSSKDKEFLK